MPTVVDFLRELDHPRRDVVLALRDVILEASPAIQEGIKWGAPSFRTTDDFATMNLRVKPGDDHVRLILHTGAKVKVTSVRQVADPTGLLTWLADDRGVVTFTSEEDLARRTPALQDLLRAWMAYV